MKKSNIFFVSLYVIAALAVAYFAYGVVRERYFAPEKGSSGTKNGETQSQTSDQGDVQSDSQNSEQINGDQPNDSSAVDNIPPSNGQPDVQRTDCDNNCAGYKDNADNLKYCQEVCGIRPVTPKDSESQCESLTGLDQDSCWKDLAVSKKDFSFCEKISDAKLQKVCENRVTEELLN